MAKSARSPAELRNMFGANLRKLAQDYPSISELSRQLGINRTQFNRYLSGESFPRPDVLERICTFFDVDARVLLEPVENLKSTGGIMTGATLADFVGAGVYNMPEEVFPSGFYRFSRRSFLDASQFVVGIVYVFRQGTGTFVRGFELREAMRQQGLPDDARTREFRGYIANQEDGIVAVISRRKAMTSTFNYLSRVASFENNFWVGYVTRTMRESPTATRVERMVYEYLGRNWSKVITAARQAGYHAEEDLLPFHARLLQPDVNFR